MTYSDSILRISLAAFDQASHITNLFVVPVTLARVAYLNVSGSANADYSRLIKGVVLYFVLIFSYEPILKLLLSIPADLLPDFNLGTGAGTGEIGLQAKTVMPNVLAWIFESLIIVLYYAAWFLNFAVAILFSSMAPIVFLLGGILNIGLGVGTFLSLLVMLCCWPIVFVACEGMRHAFATEMPGYTASGVSEIMIGLCKLIGPLAIAKSAMHSPVGQAMSSVASAGVGGTTGAINHGSYANAGFQGKEFTSQPRTLTQMISQQTGKLAHAAGGKLRDLSHDQSSRPQPNSAKHNASANTQNSQRDISSSHPSTNGVI